MALTTAQLITLKAAILADAVLNAYPNTSDGNFDMASGGPNQNLGLRALAAGPNNIGWKSNVVINAIGDAINGTELAGLSTLNNTRLQTLVQLSESGVNPSVANRRQFFDDIFSGAGGVNTRAALLVLWKRTLNKLEKIFAIGTGSDASPATLVVEGSISGADVTAARNLP